MELTADLMPYLELLFLLMIGQAFASQLFGQKLYKLTPNWDVINYALLAALPVYVVTSSVALSLAEFAVSSVLRFGVDRQAIKESTLLTLGVVSKIVWVALLYMGVAVVME